MTHSLERPDQIFLFERLAGISVRKDVSAGRLTTMAAGANVSAVIEPDSLEQLVKVVKAARTLSVPLRVLGGGSNVVLPDERMSAAVLRLGKGFRTFEPLSSDGEFSIGASMPLMSLSRILSEEGYSGLEFAGGIPAWVGGATAMNAGAHGGEFGDRITSVTWVRSNGEVERVEAGAVEFGYRSSRIPEGTIVVEVRIRLALSEREKTAAKRAEFLAERKKRQPLSEPSAGSVFRNPVGDRSAGQLLEESGMKGQSVGEAFVSRLHANWIVNPSKSARQEDIRQLMVSMERAVEDKFGLRLHPEIKLW
ncbi:MAG: UDP-N-acetylmuramate dehydrogenase [Bdellovibrionales bacterium]|nr:UDP-N-acetylmuramate dehydrogenase [Bdellovibrionales bacterium]